MGGTGRVLLRAGALVLLGWARGGFAEEAEPFSLLNYRLTPYAEPELLFNLGGSIDNAHSGWTSFSAYGDSIDTRDYDTDNFVLGASYARERTGLDRDLDLLLPVDLRWNHTVFGNDSESWQVLDPARTRLESRDRSDNYYLNFYPSGGETWYGAAWQAGWKGNLTLVGQYAEDGEGSGQTQYLASGPVGLNHSSDYFRSWQFSAVGHAELRAGLGRRVETRWAWNAMETLRVLQEHGALRRDLSPAEEQELAELMARLGSEFGWDFRDQRLRDTHALWDFLVSKGALARDDPDAVVILSDTYLLPKAPRLRGAEWLLVPEVDAQAAALSARDEMGYTDPPSSYDSDQGAVHAPAPGLGLEGAWSKPLSRAWQVDAKLRVDYRPFRSQRTIVSPWENASQAWTGALNLGLGYFKDERLSWTLTDGMSLSSARLEHWDALGNGVWQEAYDDRGLTNALNLAFGYQMTYAVNVSLSLGWIASVEWRQNGSYAGLVPGPGSDAFLAAWQGPAQWISSEPVVNLSASYRLF